MLVQCMLFIAAEKGGNSWSKFKIWLALIPRSGYKILFTIAFLIVLQLLPRIASAFIRESSRDRYNGRIWFWAEQGLNLITAVLLILGLLEIWFDNPNWLATAIELVIAGVAFALQKVIMALNFPLK